MSSYGGYGVGQQRVPKPVATSPYTTYGGLSPYQTAPVPKPPPVGPTGLPGVPSQTPHPSYVNNPAIHSLSTPGINAGIPGVSQPSVAPAPTAPNVYDINTDPALQAITALVGRNDADAKAAALQQETGQLLGYGDPNLAAALLGENDPNVKAAAANPTSTLAQLAMGRDRNVHQLTEDLNKQNLFFGGYRVTQEQQAAQDYQNALAGAAAGVHGNLDTIQSNLAAALAANQGQRITALQNAYTTHANDPGYDPTGGAPAPGTTPTTGAANITNPTLQTLTAQSAAPVVDPNLAAVLAAAQRSLGPRAY